MAVSDKPWSRFGESDYNDEQWYEACLIKPPKSEYTAKAQAKLPVRDRMARWTGMEYMLLPLRWPVRVVE